MVVKKNRQSNKSKKSNEIRYEYRFIDKESTALESVLRKLFEEAEKRILSE